MKKHIIMSPFLYKAVAFLLCLCLCLSFFPRAMAEEEQNGVVPEVGTEDLSFVGDSCIGVLAARSLEQEEDLDQMPGSVTEVLISGTIATVELTTTVQSKLVVAIYNEEGLEMLGSGLVDVRPGITSTIVRININEMPAYFVTGAYLLDADTLEPISQKYISRYYTEEFQTFLASTIEDYDESLVLNLDENVETNYLVYTEDTIRVTEQSEVNQIIDNNDGSYTILNADETVRSLIAGDKFSCATADGTLIVLRVGSITTEGTTVTITEDETATLEDLFAYIKLEEDSDGTGGYVEPDGMDTGVAIETISANQLESFAASDSMLFYNNYNESLNEPLSGTEIAIDENAGEMHVYAVPVKNTDFSWGSSFKYKLDASPVGGSLTFGLSVSYKFYKSDSWIYQSFKTDMSAKITVSFGFEYTGIIGLGKPVIPFGASGLKASFPLRLVLEAEAKAEVSGEIKGTIGFEFDSDFGEINNTSLPKFTSDSDLEFEGSIFIGLEFEAEISTFFSLAATSVTVKTGYELKGKMKGFNYEDVSGSKHHDCASCLQGSVSVKFSSTVKLSALMDKIKVTFDLGNCKLKLADFYYSFDNHEFGWGVTCPYISYRVKIHVLRMDASNPEGIPIDGATIEIEDIDPSQYPITKKEGIAELFLPSGEYKISTSPSDSLYGEMNITVLDFPREVKLWVDDRVFAYGKWGTLDWTLDKQGLLTISGDGAMDDLDLNSDSAWRNFYEQIKSVVIEEGITSIGKLAFASCSNLISVIIPTTLNYIHCGAFYGCDSIASVYIRDLAKWCNISFQYGYPSYYDYDRYSNPLFYGGNLYLNDNLVQDLVIPQGINSIEGGAFSGCSSIISVTIPSSINIIPERLFKGCSNLERIEISNGITWIGSDAFYKCTSLTDINIPDSVTRIQDWAFGYCSSLTEINIPDSITSIHLCTFSDCSSLSEIVLPDSVEEIGTCAFRNCRNLQSFTIPPKVSVIEDQTFYGCSNLTSVEISPSVTTIGRLAFCNCESLSSITIPSSVATLGSSAFLGCSNLISIELSNNISAISFKVFDGCSSLQNISLPFGITSIGESAFARCSSLKSISIPNSMDFIDDYAFTGCRGLRDIYYSGTYEQWANIHISYGLTENIYDSGLHYATVHYLDNTQNTSIPFFTFSAENDGETQLKAFKAFPYSERIVHDSKSINLSEIEFLAAFTGGTVQEDNYKLATFNNLVSGGNYILLVVENPESKNLLASDNLLYISQLTADESGYIILRYLPCRDTENNYALAFGTSPKNLADAEIILNQEAGGFTIPSVSYDGITLNEDIDYTFIANNDDNLITVTIRGRGEYSGTAVLEAEKIPHTPGNLVWEVETSASDPLEDEYYKTIRCLACDAELSREPVSIRPDLILPAALTRIENEAFAGCAFTYVKLSEQIVSIGWHAFAGCPKLAYIYIPAATTEIDTFAFGEQQNLTIIGKSDSFAETYAQENHFSFVSISS